MEGVFSAKGDKNKKNNLSYEVIEFTKVAVVTGSGKGIGKLIALAFGERGYSVVTNERDPKYTKKTAKQIEDRGGEAHPIPADVSKPKEVDKLVDGARQKFGSIDVMICNAGIQTESPFLNMEFEKWQNLIDVNLTGTFLCGQRAAQYMVEQENGGVIINMSSVHQTIPWPLHAHYAASKGGIKMLTESMALELADKGVRVNAIAPGAIKTPMNQDILENQEKKRNLENLIPMGRMAEPEEVAEIALFLASDKAKYVTGSTYFIDGGLSLYPSFRSE